MSQGDGNILERMCDLIGGSEDRLLDSLATSMRESGHVRAPHAEPDWRDSIRGLSDAVFQAVYGVPHGYAEGAVGSDPVVAFGVLRGMRHRSRGVDADAWLQLLRHHRAAYVEVLGSAGFDEDDEEVCRHFLQSVFDRFERGFLEGYRRPERSDGEDPTAVWLRPA